MVNHPAFIVIGACLVIVVMVDVLASTVRRGEGSLTGLLEQSVCYTFARLYSATQNRLVLAWSGVIAIMVMVTTWVVILWLGWLLIFCSGETAVVSTGSGEPADLWSRIYFSGYALSTMGTGDYRPEGALWQVITAIAAFNGLFLTSVIISFLVPMAQAEAFKRQVALRIYHAGHTAQDLVLNTWNPETETALEAIASSLVGDLVQLQQSHVNFPVLHRFHSSHRQESIKLGIATLDEALTLAECGLDGATPVELTWLRQSLVGYLKTFELVNMEPTDEPPPPPSLALLRQRGLPTVSEAEFHQRVSQLTERRRWLLAMVRSGGWSWQFVHSFEEPAFEALTSSEKASKR